MLGNQVVINNADSIETLWGKIQSPLNDVTPEVLRTAFNTQAWINNYDNISTLQVASAAYYRIYSTLHAEEVNDIAILTGIAYDIRLLSSLVSSSIQFTPEQIVAIVRKANDILLDARTRGTTANLLLNLASVTEFGRAFINSQVYKMVMTGNALAAADLRLLVDFFSTFNIAKVQDLHESVCYLVGKMLTSPSANVDIDVCESVFRVLADVKSSREAAGVVNAPEYESKVYSQLSARLQPFLSAAATAAEANRLLPMCNDEDLRAILLVIDPIVQKDVVGAIKAYTLDRLNTEVNNCMSLENRWKKVTSRYACDPALDDLLQSYDTPSERLSAVIYASKSGATPGYVLNTLRQQQLLNSYLGDARAGGVAYERLCANNVPW
jgi:hypothetical protein